MDGKEYIGVIERYFAASRAGNILCMVFIGRAFF